MRLNKFIAHASGLSRREADQAIAEGKVTINGEVAKIGANVSEQDSVYLDDKLLTLASKYTVLAFNKPTSR